MSSKSPAEVAILLPQNDQFNFAQTLARKIHSVEITKLSSDTGSLVRTLFSAQFVGENLILLWRALLLTQSTFYSGCSESTQGRPLWRSSAFVCWCLIISASQGFSQGHHKASIVRGTSLIINRFWGRKCREQKTDVRSWTKWQTRYAYFHKARNEICVGEEG